MGLADGVFLGFFECSNLVVMLERSFTTPSGLKASDIYCFALKLSSSLNGRII